MSEKIKLNANNLTLPEMRAVVARRIEECGSKGYRTVKGTNLKNALFFPTTVNKKGINVSPLLAFRGHEDGHLEALLNLEDSSEQTLRDYDHAAESIVQIETGFRSGKKLRKAVVKAVRKAKLKKKVAVEIIEFLDSIKG